MIHKAGMLTFLITLSCFAYSSSQVDSYTITDLKKQQKKQQKKHQASHKTDRSPASQPKSSNNENNRNEMPYTEGSKKNIFYGQKTGVSLSDATPEDITSENYPEVIESFVFPNAELKDVIKAMSTDLNINIIMSPDIANKRISIVSYSPITVAEAYQAFLSALSIHGLTVIRSGSFLKIVSSENAVKSNSKIYKGHQQLNTDQFVTRIIKPKYINVGELELKIKPLVDSKTVNSLIFYPPSNMIIISDYSLNVEKIRKIIKTLDVPSQDNIFKVIPIKHAQADMLTQIIGQLLLGMGSSSSYYRRRTGGKANISIKKQSINIHSLSHDERTNSIIVMGNKAGIRRVESLIKQLDYYKDPELAGGIFVYKVKHGLAEELSKTLNEVIGSSVAKVSSKTGKKAPTVLPSSRRFRRNNMADIATAQSFEDVRIIAEKNTNSLLIVSNKFNYETILNILKKVDISRNQVFVKAIIMELSTDRNNDWQIANYYFPKGGKGISRIGYGLNSLTDLATTEGATLMFPLSLLFNSTARKSTSNFSTALKNVEQTDIKGFINFGTSSDSSDRSSGSFMIPSLSSFIKFLQKTVGGNILSTPQVIALDHQEAKVTIEDRIPTTSSLTQFGGVGIANQTTSNIKYETVTTQLVITPHINPDVNSVRLKIKQKIDSIVDSASIPENLRKSAVGTKKRSIETSITLKNNETAVIGGLTRASNTNTTTKVPILGDLPLLGWLFKNSQTEREQSNLIVFITPNIIRSTDEHKNILSKKLKERMEFIRQFTGNKDPYKKITEEMTSKETPPPLTESLPNSELDITVPPEETLPDEEETNELFEPEDIIEEPPEETTEELDTTLPPEQLPEEDTSSDLFEPKAVINDTPEKIQDFTVEETTKELDITPPEKEEPNELFAPEDIEEPPEEIIEELDITPPYN